MNQYDVDRIVEELHELNKTLKVIASNLEREKNLNCDISNEFLDKTNHYLQSQLTEDFSID